LSILTPLIVSLLACGPSASSSKRPRRPTAPVIPASHKTPAEAPTPTIPRPTVWMTLEDENYRHRRYFGSSAVVNEPTEEGIEHVRSRIAETASGYVLADALALMMIWRVDPATLPAPRREALRDFFGDFLFYRFRPELFWPHYPDRWQEGMRRCLLHALEEGYEINNFHHAVELLPLFFSEDELAALARRDWIAKAAIAVHGRSSYLRRDGSVGFRSVGLSRWIEAAWERADLERRREILDACFLDPTLAFDGSNFSIVATDVRDAIRGRPDSRPTSRFQIFPLLEAFEADPERFDSLLKHPHYKVRQRLVALALAWRKPELNYNDPVVRSVLIEALANDALRENEGLAERALARNGPAVRRAVSEAFRRTTDGQQARLLVDLLILFDDPADRLPLLDYLYNELPERELGAADRVHPMGRDLRYGGRLPWVAERIARIGPPAVDFLLERLARSDSPQQSALSLILLAEMGAAERVHWNPALARVVVRGLLDNKIGMDERFAVHALWAHRRRAEPHLWRLVDSDPDEAIRATARDWLDRVAYAERIGPTAWNRLWDIPPPSNVPWSGVELKSGGGPKYYEELVARYGLLDPRIERMTIASGEFDLLHRDSRAPVRWEDLADLRSLKSLELNSHDVEDAMMWTLLSCRALERVALHYTAVTDFGVRPLGAMRHLREISIYNSRVTPAGIAQLKYHLPRTNLVHYVPGRPIPTPRPGRPIG
jgi:hypothetical protein